MAGGVRSNSTETHGPHTSTPCPSFPAWTHPSPGHYKKSALARDVQSRQELHQTTIMKFVALALALLLAVGSQAASLQADAPTQLQHARAVMDVYMTQVKDSAKKALEQLDDTEYSGLKTIISTRLDDMHTQIKTLQDAVVPVTDNVVTTISDATAEFRTSVMADIDALKTEVEPKRIKLKEVIDKHIEEYRTLMQPIITEYQTQHRAEMDSLKTKLEPLMEQLKTLVATNVEETKTALMPIVESVRSKLAERLETLKAIAVPYVNDYKEQLKQAYSNTQNINAEELAALKLKIEPLAEDIKVKLQSIFEHITGTFNKQ